MPLIWHGERIKGRLNLRARQDVEDACQIAEDSIKSIMKRGGRTESGYKEEGVKKEKVGSYASSPGEPPRVQTGRLRSSITHEMDPLRPVGRVGTNVEYARALELGYAPRNLEPRPYMRPGVEKAIPAIRRHVSRRMD